MKKTVLLIDDDEMLLKSLQKGLLRLGYDVKSASCGEIALDLARRHMIHEVICDVRMPGMNGFQTLTALKRLFSETYDEYPSILAITGDYNPQIITELTKLGICDVLMKPFGIFDLMHYLQNFRALETAVTKMRA